MDSERYSHFERFFLCGISRVPHRGLVSSITLESKHIDVCAWLHQYLEKDLNRISIAEIKQRFQRPEVVWSSELNRWLIVGSDISCVDEVLSNLLLPPFVAPKGICVFSWVQFWNNVESFQVDNGAFDKYPKLSSQAKKMQEVVDNSIRMVKISFKEILEGMKT